MQQTVMDSEGPCGSLPPPMQAVADPNPLPGMDALGINAGEEPEASSETPPPAPAPAPTYDQLFPALRGGLGSGGMSSQKAQAPAWGAQTTNDDMKIRSSNVMQVFQLQREDLNLDNFGADTSHSICAEITKRTGARIEISSGKDSSLSFLISGKHDAVPKAKKLLLEKFTAQNTRTIKVPKEHHKIILGKKGKRLQDLEAMTSTKITVPGVNDSSELITIVGSKEDIEKAVDQISMRSDEQLKNYQDVVTVPKMYHPFITGGSNANTAALTAEYGVRIAVPYSGAVNDDITLTGEKENIAKVKEIITLKYKEMEKVCTTISVEVAKTQHKYVVGAKGSGVAEILNLHGVSVEVPPPDSSTGTITLRGPAEKLGMALTLVYEKANSQVTDEVRAPMWLHRYIIGKKGANINKITEEYPSVHIEMEDAAERIKLDGPKAEVQKVHANLTAMIEEMLSRITRESIPVDPKYHRFIIGKSGANVNKIRNDTNVYINFEDNAITLEGVPKDVETAKKELMEIITKLENEKEKVINIDSRFHRLLIGTKGDKIREVKEQFPQVQINFPDQGQRSDVVKVRGPKDEVDACCKHLQKTVKSLLESNFQIKLSIFKEFMKFVIGKGGSNINKIRQDCDVRIDFSSQDTDGSDEIVITGKKENCEKAKAKIQEIESELANVTVVDILIPAKLHNAIIGQGGKLIRSIRDECGGVTVKFPNAGGKKPSDKVTIRGPKDDVMKCKQILIELSNEKQLAGFTTEVKCKASLHKFLIGKNGATVRKIRDKTGARIVFPTDKDEDKEAIVIIGKKEQVAAAKKDLEAIISECENVVESTVNVPPQHHYYFTSRRAEVLRQLADEFGDVRVSFPKQGTNSDIVTIKGAKECVAGAKDRILEIVSDLVSQITMDVYIPQKHHRTVLGPRGSNVQEIIKIHNIKIKFPDRRDGPNDFEETQLAEGEGPKPWDLVRLTGPADKCEAAKQALLSWVPVALEVEVPFKFHSKIIGKGGEMIRKVMEKHKVQIRMPPAHQQSDIITIHGSETGVQGARDTILENVEALHGEDRDRELKSFQITVNVDPQFHSKIIGKKGATIIKLREKYGVNIRIPDRDDQDPTLITVIGYQEKAEQAREAIIDIAGELASQITMDVPIDASFHARLIGQRGRNIRKIMDRFKVLISFPGANAKEEGAAPNAGDIITITGSENKCNECSDHLLNQVEEFKQELEEKDEHDNFYKAYQAPRAMDFGASLAAVIPNGNEAAVEEGAQQNGTHETAEPQKTEEADPWQAKQGFVVSGAPWAQETPNMLSNSDFPSMGAPSGVNVPSASVWGPRRT